MLSVLVINCVPMPNVRKVCVVFGATAERLRPMVDEAQKKRLSYRNRAVEKNEEGMRQSLENVVPW